ncbi:MAG: hypothetical protein Kow006_09840 [Gammaproteobacteria bacterium]
MVTSPLQRSWISSVHAFFLTLFLAILTGGTTDLYAAAEDSEAHESGRRIYNFRCYYCHGYSGDARTLASRFLVPPPRNFRATPLSQMPRDDMIAAVRDGRPGTAMKPFHNTLTESEIERVVDFVRREFMERGADNTRYHTAENGWPDHERYRAAYPFATGEVALDTPWEALNPRQQRGKRLFLASCISCHDRSHVADPRVTWERQAISYPRFGFAPGDFLKDPDAISGASPFAQHDLPLKLAGLTRLEQEGERLYLDNCAFCHAADGTGKNWIGRFLDPHPRNLRDPQAMAGMTRQRLKQILIEGKPGTSMPAWGSVLSEREMDALIAYIGRAFYPLAEN